MQRAQLAAPLGGHKVTSGSHKLPSLQGTECVQQPSVRTRTHGELWWLCTYLEVKTTKVDTHLVYLFACRFMSGLPHLALHGRIRGACRPGEGGVQLCELVAGIHAADITPKSHGAHDLLGCALNGVGGLVFGVHAGDVLMDAAGGPFDSRFVIDRALRCSDVSDPSVIARIRL